MAQVQIRLVFTITRVTDTGNVVSFIKNEPTSHGRMDVTLNLNEAFNMVDMEVEAIIGHMEMALKMLPQGATLQLQEVTSTVELKAIDTNEGVYLEERRRRAFQKLDARDIEALGLKGMAIYDKLKFHNND